MVHSYTMMMQICTTATVQGNALRYRTTENSLSLKFKPMAFLRTLTVNGDMGLAHWTHWWCIANAVQTNGHPILQHSCCHARHLPSDNKGFFYATSFYTFSHTGNNNWGYVWSNNYCMHYVKIYLQFRILWFPQLYALTSVRTRKFFFKVYEYDVQFNSIQINLF